MEYRVDLHHVADSLIPHIEGEIHARAGAAPAPGAGPELSLSGLIPPAVWAQVKPYARDLIALILSKVMARLTGGAGAAPHDTTPV